MAVEKRTVNCSDCGRDIEVRSNMFAHQTLSNHKKKEHK